MHYEIMLFTIISYNQKYLISTIIKKIPEHIIQIKNGTDHIV